MIRTFQYRVQLSNEAEAHCLNWLERCRTLYNLALEQRITIYRQNKKSISYYDQQYQRGLVLGRDENAALNIQTLGQSVQALTSVMSAGIA